MNPIVLLFADGTSFFVGLALVLISELLLFRVPIRVIRSVLTVLVLVGATWVVISATPLPIWMYSVWGVSALAGLILGNRWPSSQRSRYGVCLVLLMTTCGLCLAELPYHWTPHLVIKNNPTIYVLGDSISAGMGTTERCWPTVLKEMTQRRVINLAQPGATVGSAVIQVKGITESNAVVIIEIGGNDLLGGTGAAKFRDRLDGLVSSLSSSQHSMLIVELPLFPFQNGFGQAQRSIAAKYGAALLPKRVFAHVLRTKNGTLDGLHLSPEGHQVMARSIANIIQKE